MIMKNTYKGVVALGPTKNLEPIVTQNSSSESLNFTDYGKKLTDVNLVVLESKLVDLNLDDINSVSENKVANSDGASTQKARRWSLFSCFRGSSTSNRDTNSKSSCSFFDFDNRRKISGDSAVSENVRDQNQETVKESASSIGNSLQSCLSSLPSINYPRVSCPAIALPSMDQVSEGCERFTSCLGTVGNGLATAAGYAGEALIFIGQIAGPACTSLGRLGYLIGRVFCCLVTGGASES